MHNRTIGKETFMSVTDSSRVNLERRAWRSVFQDGLWDIALGIVFLGVGLAVTFHLPRRWDYSLNALTVVLSIAVFSVGKRRVTIPRLGWVKFGPRGRQRRRNAVIVLATGVLLTALLRLIPSPFSPTPLVSALTVATLVWTVLSLMAAFWEFPRLYILAVIISASFFAVELLGRGWPLLVGPAIVLAIGIGYLTRFLRLYPKPAAEVFNASH
jgi:hypothetical protein